MTESTKTDAERKPTRRRLLGLGGAGMAGLIAGRLAAPQAAGAADGDGLKIGQANAGAAKTSLTTVGTIVDDGALVVDGQNADYGVVGSAKSVGVYGKGPIGVYGDGAVGGVFAGTDAAINLTPRAAGGPPTGQSLKGDMAIDADGVLWLCVADGTPGTWIRISHGGANMLPEPRRAFDSRNPGAGGIFPGYSTRTIEIVAANIGVPAIARGIVCNLTVAETSNIGFLTAYPTGTARPITSNLNWAPLQTVANSATVRLGDGGRIDIYVELSDAHVIVDVAGYIL